MTSKKIRRASLFLVAALLCFLMIIEAADKNGAKVKTPVAELQQAFRKLEFGMFIHFNMATYKEVQWVAGYPSPADFNPGGKIDTDAWADAAVSAGMTYAVLTAKHVSGFCLWDSKHTTYDVMHPDCPYQRDFIAQFIKSFKSRGLKVGLYYCWRHPGFGDAGKYKVLPPECDPAEHDLEAQIDFQKRQIAELLARYPDVFYLWNDALDPKIMPADALQGYLKKMRPGLLTSSNWWDWGKKGTPYADIAIKECRHFPETNQAAGETCWKLERGWFWSKGARAGSVKGILSHRARAYARNSNFLLNVGPDQAGNIVPSSVEALAEIGKATRQKRAIWADQPLVIDLTNVEKPRKYFQRMWDSCVYPIGNGRLGAVIYGEPKKETIQFNEDSLWVGNEDCTGGYQPFGEVNVEMPHEAFTGYRRELDISRAVHTITYASGGVRYKREYFSSHPAQVMAFRFTADKKAALSGRVSMGNQHEVPVTVDSATFTMKGNTSTFWLWQLHLDRPDKLLGSRAYASDKLIDLDFEAQMRVQHEGGSVKAVDNTLVFDKCDSLTLYLAADTNYINQRGKGWRGPHPHERVKGQVAAAAKRAYAELLEEHVADYQGLYNRLSIHLGPTPDDVISLPTAKRVEAYSAQVRKKAAPPVDRDLEALLYQYARYLMISCSRPGGGALPANLQGLWLINRYPAWRCDYHTDINLQMNYWFVDPANLSECFVPLAEWIDSIREVRKEETRRVLDVRRGWLMRSENGVFGGSTWHFQKGDSAWLCQNLWDHYTFTRDRTYLARYAYPVMKEISEFWVDHLKALPDGTLVAPKGRSPEHGPTDVDGVSYDQQLCWDLFTNMIEASEVLGVDADYRKALMARRKKLLGPQIGKWGQLQEWMEDIDDPKDTHRHINHMVAVYPGRQIHPAITPDFAGAAKVGLMARGDGGPGWSQAWKTCIYARLLEAERAYTLLSGLMASRIYGNLWASHPPFQIDCNFGYPAGVNEMLVQSHLGYIQLLPALPEAWSEGHVNGMRVRGGFELDLSWKGGALVQAVVRRVTRGSGRCMIRYGKGGQAFMLKMGESRKLGATDFKAEAGTGAK